MLFSEVLAGLLKCRSPETNFTSSSGLDVFCALDVKSRLFISWMGVWVQALRWEQTSGSRGITCYWVKSVLFFFFFFGLQTGKTFTLKWCLYRCIFGVKCVWVTTGSVGVLQTVRNNFAFICTAFFHMMNAPQGVWHWNVTRLNEYLICFMTDLTSSSFKRLPLPSGLLQLHHAALNCHYTADDSVPMVMSTQPVGCLISLFEAECSALCIQLSLI